MSLITTNNTTLKDIAIILISSEQGEKTIKKEGDFVQVFIGEKLVAINVFNASKYFKLSEGVHTLSEEQVDVLKSKNIYFDFNSNFSVGEVISRETHPKSEKLFLLKVQTEKELQIVTNSLNSLVGTKVVVARIGAILPSGLMITHSKVMGVESEGMLCGGETLGREQTEGVLLVEGNNGDNFIL